MVSKPEILGVVLTIIALLFEIFVLVSGAGNLPVLRSVYFAKVDYFGNFVNMGLWYIKKNIDAIQLCRSVVTVLTFICARMICIGEVAMVARKDTKNAAYLLLLSSGVSCL